MEIVYRDIRDINLSDYVQFVGREDHKEILVGPPGKEHYALLAYLAKQVSNSIIFELGTHHGTSSLALSTNATNDVVTYDIDDCYGIEPQPKNVIRKIGDIFAEKSEKAY